MNNDPVRSQKILIGTQAIRHYLAKHDGSPVSWATVKEYISWGMPAAFKNGGWIAHADHIDAFFKELTFARGEADPEEGDYE